MTTPDNARSPFGGTSRHLQTLPTAFIIELYRRKCDVDISTSFIDINEIHLFECEETGYQFWRPEDAAGDELFYQTLSMSWPNYYRRVRWEYRDSLKVIAGSKRLVEIGCGQGYFLRMAEKIVDHAVGIELNQQAIQSKVTKFRVEQAELDNFARNKLETFDVFCAFQVLEHLVHPDELIETALRCLAPKGLLLLSTPNNEFIPHIRQTDAFDLPPHHVGHFRESVYRRLASKYGLDIVDIKIEPRQPEPEIVTAATRKNVGYRLARGATRLFMTCAYRLAQEPGPNILAIFRKN